MNNRMDSLYQFPKVMKSILKVETRKEHSELYGLIRQRETDINQLLTFSVYGICLTF